ncbi:Uncharacterised protein [uncultured archaeon]|nr:Uncharacterised protein [uncultured archaeon]
MKFRKDKDILQFMGVGIGMILAGLATFKYLHPAGMGLAISGAVLTLIGLLFATKPKEILLQDERSKRINEKAGYYGFWAILAIITVMNYLNITKLWIPTFFDTYSIIIFTGIYCWIILRWHFNKKGDTE